MRRGRDEEALNYILNTSKISWNKKEASNLSPNIQLVSNKINKTDNTSVGNLIGKSIKKQKEKEIKI